MGCEADLDGFKSPIPIAADESVQSSRDIAALVGRFDVINIKLDKCGGLTEALAMAAETRRHGMDVMVGNMTGTSLAMAPAFLVGQLCKVVDLDGPVFLREDRAQRLRYRAATSGAPRSYGAGPPPESGGPNEVAYRALCARRVHVLGALPRLGPGAADQAAE